MTISLKLHAVHAAVLGAIAVAASVAAGTGCSAGSGDETGAAEGAATTLHDVKPLDVNDVSILFADDAHGEPVPSMPIGEALWPQAIFDQVTAFTEKADIRLHAEAKKRANWRVVAMRFDPCASIPDFHGGVAPAAAALGSLHHGVGGTGEASCSTMQIRLSVQPMMGKDLIDTAAHLIFNLPATATPEPFVQKLLDIKNASAVATSGKPLGVHPGLVGAPQASPLAKKIADFVTTTVASSTLFSVAFVGLGEPNEGRPDGSPWTFFNGFVSGAAFTAAPPVSFDLTHQKPVTFSAPAITFTGVAGDGILLGPQKIGDALTALGLTTKDIPTTQALVVAGDPNDPDSSGGPPPPAAEQSVVHRIDNPVTTSVLTTDCTSCHTSSPSTVKLQIADDPALRFSVPKGITGYASISARQTGPDDYVVRSLGYMPSIAVADGGDGKNHPIVSNRAATDSALVADILNRQVLKLPANGTLDCSAPAVWSCFAVSGKSDHECLAKCR